MRLNVQNEYARLTFTLELESPGPSQGDAMEHLEHLGFNPGSFAEITLLNEVMQGQNVTAIFEVSGKAYEVERLRQARKQIPISKQHLITPWTV
jgi:hypothetical protein